MNPPSSRQPTTAAEATALGVRRARSLPLVEIAVLAAVGTACAAALGGVVAAVAVAAAVPVLCLGLWVLAFHPLAIFLAMAFVLGAAPGVQVPVLGISFTFTLALGLWIAIAVMPDAQHRVTWAPGLSLALVAVCTVTLLAYPITGAAVGDYVRWVVTAAAVYPLTALPRHQLLKVGRAFVAGSCVAAVFGLLLLAVDPDGRLIDRLQVLGYNAPGYNNKFIYNEGDPIRRFTGTYIDPNLAGLIMGIALLVAVVVLRGKIRLLAGALLVVAIAATLSRADIGSFVLGGLLLVFLGGIAAHLRRRLLLAGLATAAGFLMVPAVRIRIGESFGENDAGTSDRLDAFRIFPGQMEGKWIVGRGWGLPELNDPLVAIATNHVANTPLLTVFRAGVVAGLILAALLGLAAVRAWRLLRGPQLEAAILGAGFLGLLLVALQLDFPVVTLTPATLTFALLLAFLSSEYDHQQQPKPTGRPHVR